MSRRTLSGENVDPLARYIGDVCAESDDSGQLNPDTNIVERGKKNYFISSTARMWARSSPDTQMRARTDSLFTLCYIPKNTWARFKLELPFLKMCVYQ